MSDGSALRRLGRSALDSLAGALASGRLMPPYSHSALGRFVPESLTGEVASDLESLASSGMAPEQVALALRLLVAERESAQSISDRLELVWSGIEEIGSTTRDTAVVVRELFREARRSVLVASYTVDTGEKAASLFGPLAQRLDEDAELSVRLVLNVERPYRDETPESVLLREFADRLKDRVWPGERLPEVFYDPRALAPAVGGRRASMHAKCVVVDEERAFVTSANFTEAAQERNIEAGVLIDDSRVAKALRSQFERLVERGLLRRLGGLE